MIYAPITDHSGWANAEPGPDPIRNFVAEGVTSHASYVIKVRSASVESRKHFELHRSVVKFNQSQLFSLLRVTKLQGGPVTQSQGLVACLRLQNVSCLGSRAVAAAANQPADLLTGWGWWSGSWVGLT